MKFLRDWLLNNWSLKLLALGISFLLWTTYTTEPFSEVGYLVPLECRNVPADLEVSDDLPTQVHVRARGRSGLVRRLVAADFSAAVDVAGRPAGEMVFELRPDQIVAPYGVTVVSVSPAQIRIRLAPRRTTR